MQATTFTDRHFNLRNWLVIGVVLEVLIFSYCYFSFAEINEVFRHAARYSGQLSLVVYLLALTFFLRLLIASGRQRVGIICAQSLLFFACFTSSISGYWQPTCS